MPYLNGFAGDRQDVLDNSCWACAGRAIHNYYVNAGFGNALGPLISDQEFAAAAAALPQGDPVIENDDHVMQSAAQALWLLGYPSFMDDHVLPNRQDIADSITEGNPLLAILGVNQPPDSNDPQQVVGGHYVVIVGISDDAAMSQIRVFDPTDGATRDMAYDAAAYNPTPNGPIVQMYWWNTSYVDPWDATHAPAADPQDPVPAAED